jgi:type IV secretory pathway VirB6-like protein
MKHLPFFAAFLVMLTLTASASAADSTTPNTDSILGVTAAIESVVGQNLVNRFMAGGLQISAQMTEYAKILAGALLTVHILWQITMNMVNNKEILEGVIEDLVFGAVVVFLLYLYPVIVKDIVEFGQKIMDLGASGGIAEAVSKFIRALWGQMATIFKESISQLSSWNGFLDYLGKSIDMVIALFFSFFALILGALALAEVLSVVILGPVIIGLSIALGPLFVAMLATSWTRRWFDQWLNFFINGALLTAIMAILLSLISNVLLNQLSSSVWGSSLTGGALAMAILCLSLGKIISAVPSFADALLPGRTGAGSARTSGKDTVKAAISAKDGIKDTFRTAANLANRAKNAATKISK